MAPKLYRPSKRRPGIGRRPTVKSGLHLRYRARHGTVVRQCVSRHRSLLPFSNPLPPFPMRPALPASEYYGGSAPYSRFGGRCAYLPGRAGCPARQNPDCAVPMLTVFRSATEEPDYAPAASPSVGRRLSRWPSRWRPNTPWKFPAARRQQVRTAPGPHPPGWSRWECRRLNNVGFSRTPYRLAGRTRTIWQRWHVPALPGPLRPSGTTRARLPPASPACCDRPEAKVSHPPHGTTAPHGAPDHLPSARAPPGPQPPRDAR